MGQQLLPRMAARLADTSQPKEERLRLAMGWHRQGFDCVDVIASLSKGNDVPAKSALVAATEFRVAHPGQFRPFYGVGQRVKEAIGLKSTCPLCNSTLEEMNQLGPVALRDRGPLYEFGRRMRKNAESLAEDAQHASWWQRKAIAAGLAWKGAEGAEESAREMILTACDAEDEYLRQPVRWSVFVRTAPRAQPTLLPCVESILAAGWTPIVMAEPGTDVSGLPPGVPVVFWPSKRGAWGSMLSILRDRGRHSEGEEWVLVFEDDCILAPGAREFVERSGVLAEDKVGFVSLWTSSRQHSDAGGWHRVTEKLFRGSVAMAFPMASIRTLTADPLCDAWRGKDGNQIPPDVWNVDTALTRLCRKYDLKMLTHSPSLSQHIGNTSTLPGHGAATGGRKAKEVAVLSKPQSTMSVLVPLSGRAWAWPMLAAWLDRQTYPRDKIALRLLDTSQDEAFSALVAEWVAGCGYRHVTHVRKDIGLKGLADLPRAKNGREVNRAVAAAWASLCQNLPAEWSLCLEDDIEPPDDVIARLMESATDELDALSACYRSRAVDRHWVLRDHPSRNIPDKDEGRGVQRIAGSGFGCLLVRSEILARHPFEQLSGEGWYDWRFFDVENVRAACDWSLRCRHYTSATEWV